MPDLPEILAQEDLTVESLLYQLLLGDAKGMRSNTDQRRRITNGPPGRHRDG